jgi:acyl-CoA dehydrogenase
MDFDISPKQRQFLDRVVAFMDEHIAPAVPRYNEEMNVLGDERWKVVQVVEELKEKAKAAGLWNFFMPPHSGQTHVDDTFQFEGIQLTNLEYSMIAEQMGKIGFASEVFNCSAPDTGNMEVLMRYGTLEQKEKWLRPLMNGEIRSAFLMTEPDVASSDATNIETEIRREGDEYVINGRKWFITNAMYERSKILIVMGKSDPDNPNRHLQQSQVLVPKDTPGVKIVRPLTTLGYDDAPIGHAEVVFDNVRVPAENILLGEGRGFEIAQGRLGPGRIHHCMRLIGCAQRALEYACRRSVSRTTFGKKLAEHQSIREDVAKSFSEIEQARLLTMKTAQKMDEVGAKDAMDMIAATKITVPLMAQTVIDRCMQIHGAGGLTGDYFMAEAFNYARWCRQADGPDQVHMMALGKQIIKRYAGG